jgi:hypothetical protein
MILPANDVAIANAIARNCYCYHACCLRPRQNRTTPHDAQADLQSQSKQASKHSPSDPYRKNDPHTPTHPH